MKHKGHRRVPEEKRNREYEDLRGEYKKLRREVQQLRKENARLQGRDLELKDIMEDEMVYSEQELGFKCPYCKSTNVKIMNNVNGKDYYFCNNDDCGRRGSVK